MSAVADTLTERLIVDLYKVDGKAEIVGDRIVMMSPTGDLPSSAGGLIYASLLAYSRQHGGRAYTDNAAFLVNLPNRKSFSPDAAYYMGPRTRGKFLQGAPLFAAEVRSENDYGPRAERKIADKRREYFAAGTQVVCDVDVLRDETVSVYRTDSPDLPTIYRRGEMAEAEPAMPGWAMSVNELFE
jgi:Uma2 family endonuclease